MPDQPRLPASWLLALALLAVAVYLPGLGNGFAYDAVMLVQEDARIHTLERPWRLLASSYWPFGEQTLALYRPLVTLSFALDWAVFGGAAWGFHLTNALLHGLATALAFALLSGFVPVAAAAAGAALFAVHPVHVEAVAGIVGRSDILATALGFAALLLWTRLPSRARAARFGVPALFFLALGAKESAIMLPALLLLADAASGRAVRGRLREWLAERAIPLGGMLLLACVYLAARVAVLGGMTPESLNPVMAALPPGSARVRSALQIWPEILRLFVFPRRLLSDYGPRVLLPADGWNPRAVAGLALLVGAVCGGAYAMLRGRTRVALALLWTPVALFPVSNLAVPIGVLLAERTLYAATFALALGVALAVEAAGGSRHRLARALFACGAVCAVLAGRTVVRLPSWESTDRVFQTLMHDRPDSYRAHWHFARMAWRDGDHAAALGYYRSTLDLWPHALPVYLEAGMFATETGMERAARYFAERGLERFPEDPVLLRRLAVSALNLADTAAARVAMARGLAVVPTDPLLLMMRREIGAPPGR